MSRRKRAAKLWQEKYEESADTKEAKAALALLETAAAAQFDHCPAHLGCLEAKGKLLAQVAEARSRLWLMQPWWIKLRATRAAVEQKQTEIQAAQAKVSKLKASHDAAAERVVALETSLRENQAVVALLEVEEEQDARAW